MANEELDQPFSPIDLLQNERRSTRANIVTSLEDDPEKASRAMELAEASGAHPALVHGDLEGFEAQYKTTLVSKLLNDNKYLSEYANSHPLAAKVSNDDWGNLDTVSSSVSKLGTGTLSVLGKAVQGFKENFDADSMQADQQKLAEYLQQNPLFGNVFIRQATQGVGLALEGSLRAFSSVIGGAAAGVGELAKQLGSNEAKADRLTRDLIVWAQVGLSGQAGWHGVRGARRPAWEEHKQVEVTKELNKFQDFYNEVKPYLDAGVEPPYGIHEVVDKMKENQSKLDLDNLSDALKEAQKSNTKERNPDLFAEFLRQHTEASIGISADAVRKLYGDKPPLADDGKLGFVPRLAEQLTLAELGGGDIQVPLADWLAKVDPALAKELHDDIRVRPGGVTKNEVKEAAEVRKVKADLEAFHGSPHEFDAFSMEKIGTGEGAQSYGHGLYFAENPEVSKHYLPAKITYPEGLQTEGNLYRVRIKADKEQFLDWDKPLWEQPNNVQQALIKKWAIIRGIDEQQAAIALNDTPSTGDIYKTLERYSTPKEISKELGSAGIPGIKYLDQGSRGTRTKAEIQKELELVQRQRDEVIADPDKAERLNNMDVVKIMSRLDDVSESLQRDLKTAPETATHNFVLFDDSLVEIIAKNDQAVVATRKAAALEPLEETAFQKLYDQLARGYDYEKGGIYARIVPTKELLAEEKALVKKMNELRDRIVGKSVTMKIADFVGIGKDHQVQGAYISFDKIAPVILVSLKAENIPDTLRHEALHFLRDYNFISKAEWTTLENEARDKGWIKKHNVDKQYEKQGLNEADMLEEAIAKEYGEWGSTTAKAAELTEKYSTKAGAAFEKIKQILSQIKQAITETFGHSPDVTELFEKIESGEIKNRGPGEPRDGAKDIRPRTSEFQPELPQAGTTRMEDRAIFSKSAAIGMTVDQYKRYMRLIEKRNAEDQAAITEIALKEERKHQTQEWKANSAIIRAEVAEDIRARPDIAADDFIRAGEHKLATDALTPEQATALPKSYVAKSGVHPDDLAGFFGYSTGSQLVDRVIALNQARDAAGMKPDAYLRRVIDAETERRMQQKYGDLDRNIIEEAKEHVLSETQMDLLHEETLALGMKAGSELSITKEQMKAWVKGEFDNTTVSAVSSDKYLAAAGRAGRNAEMHLLREEPGEAFKYKQQQYIVVTMARLAKQTEKELEQFERRAKRHAQREVSGEAPEYTNYIQSILLRLGQPLRRSIQDLQDNIAMGDYKTFNDFVASKTSDLRDLHVPEFLLDPNFQKELGKLTVQEFEQVNNAIKAMEFNGRDELKVLKGGEKADLKEVIDEMVAKAATLGPAKEYPIDRKPNPVINTAKSWWWSGITVESMLNRLDRDNPRGVFYQTITRHFTDASNHKDRMIRDYQRKVSEIGKIPDMDKMVENSLFIDPLTGEAFPMRRRNVLGILQNVGNENNLKKLAEGYGLKPEQVMQWLRMNTEKADWDRAQKIGDIFAEIFDKANVMSHQISGIGIQRLPLAPIDTPFGTYPGWYNPVKYDPVRPGKSRALLGPEPEAEGYYRATTPQGYTQQRSGYIAPMELNLDIVPVRMKQMIHDITMRPAVLQLSKIFYNPEFKKAMIKHFGQHQAEEMIPFLRDIANSSNFKSLSTHLGETALEYIRQNTIATLIGFNPGTVMKHGTTALFNSMTEVGTVNWTREFFHLVGADEASAKRNWTMAMEKSEELSRRMRNFQELISGHGREINIKGAQSTFGSYREFMTSAGATPVSISDLLSAVPTFLAEYKKQIAAGTDEGMAVSLANRAVRRAHGSSVLSNKPSIARTNALGAWFSSLYGFFSHMQQKQYEITWKAKDLLKDTVGKGSGDAELATRHAPDILRGLMSYIIIPAIVEELVTPYTNSEKESWGLKAAKTMAMGISSSFVGVRDFVRAIINVRDPQAGLVGTTYKAGSDLVRDLSKGKDAFSKEKAGNIIKHSTTLVGVLTGLTNAQEGRMAEYMYRYSQGLEKPKGVWEAAVGLRYGKTEGHPKTFEKYLQHLKGH